MRVRASVNETPTFPERLKEALKRAHITQEELAQKAGISQSSVSYYILGDRFPRLPALYKMAKVLNVNPQWLLGNDTQPDSDTILEKYFRLDDADQAKVLGFITALLSDSKYGG